MLKEITNVYVPVKTPDHKKWALLLALLIHSGILGFIIYTNHTKNLDEPVMETTLVTPEQLSAIQGQIAANQNNQANNAGDSLNPDGKNANAPSMSEFLAGGSHSNIPAPQPTPSPEAQAIADDLARQQAEFEAQRDALAAKLDKEAEAELQNVAKNIDEQQMADNAKVSDLKVTESNADKERATTKKALDKANKNLKDLQAKQAVAQRAVNQSFNLPSGEPGAGVTPGGDGLPRPGINRGADVAGYRNIVQSIIKSNWHPPTNAKDGTKQTAYFDISASGVISNVRVDGNESPLKSSLTQAIQNSSLPAPPPELVSRFSTNTMQFVVDK